MTDDTDVQVVTGKDPVVTVKQEVELSEYHDSSEEINYFQHMSFLGGNGHQEAGENGESFYELDLTWLPPQHNPGTTGVISGTEVVLHQTARALTPAPTLVTARQGTPCRVRTGERSQSVPKTTSMIADRRRCSKDVPLRRGTGQPLRNGGWSTKEPSKFKECLQRLWKLGSKMLTYCGTIILSKLRSLVAYFGPGLLLACIIYWTIPLNITSSDATTGGLATNNNPRLSGDTQLISSASQAVLDEMYTAPHKSQFCPSDPDYVINLTSQCQLKNQEHKEKILVLEEEISDLRQQFSEKLALKEEKIDKLVRGITNFRLDRFCVLKTSFYQCTLAFVISAIPIICYIVQYFKQRNFNFY